EHGLPVVATDAVGAVDDLVEHGTNGLVVPAGSVDRLREAMESVRGWSTERRGTAAAASRSRLADWSVEKAVDGILAAGAAAVSDAHSTRRRPAGALLRCRRASPAEADSLVGDRRCRTRSPRRGRFKRATL